MKKFLYKNSKILKYQNNIYYTKEIYTYLKKNYYLNNKIRFLLQYSKQKKFKRYALTKSFNFCLLTFRARGIINKFYINRMVLKTFLNNKNLYQYNKKQ